MNFFTISTTTTTTTPIPIYGDVSCDHIPGFISRETNRKFEDFRTWYAGIFGYVICTICSVGVVTCAMSIIVLTRKKMIFSGSILLTWLVAAQLIKSACYLPYIVNSFIVLPRDRFGYPHSAPEKGWVIYHLSAIIVSTMCSNISVGLTISLAVFRCIYILFPNKARKYCSPFRSKLTVIITISCGFVINMPTYYIFTWYSDHVTKTDTYIILQRFHVDNKWHDIYYYVHSILLKLVPSALLIVLTMILIIAMSRTFKNWQEEERRVTNMLLSVVILFTFSESFHALLILLSKLVPCFKEIFYYGLFSEVIETITFSTSITNCMLYVLMSERFRKTFLKLFCPGCKFHNRTDWPKAGKRVGSQNPSSGHKPTGASSDQRETSSQQRGANSHQHCDAISYLSYASSYQSYASSLQQCGANSLEHGEELYGSDYDETAIPGARHARGPDLHRISDDSTSV